MSTTNQVQESLERGEPAAAQEQIIEQDGQHRQLALQNAFQQLRTLQEQADWFGRVVDMSDISNFGDGNRPWFIMDRATAESRALIYPGATASAYVNESELRLLRARSRAFVLTNPYWLGIQHNRVTYTVGFGHNYKVVKKKRNDPELPEEIVATVQVEIDLFRKKNRWARRQSEKIRRKDRDGEFFLRYFEDNPDGVLRVRFVEPLLVWNPPGKSSVDDVWFGIQYAGDYEEPVGYYVRPANYLGATASDDDWRNMVPADQIQHRTANVDLSSPRGLPTTYAIQTRLEQALRTLSNTGAIVEFRARIALIRKHVNAVQSTVKQMLGAQPGGGIQKAGPDGTMMNAYSLPQAAILDTNDQTTYEFPTNDTQVDKIVSAIQAELRSCAASLGMPEYMVSADASNANFSSTMVAEGPAVKTFEQAQQECIEEDLEVLERAILVAEKAGRIPAGTMEKIKIDAEAPVIVSRDRLQETQADEILARNKVLSKLTWAARSGLNGDEEQGQIEQERDADAAYSIDDMTDPLTGLPKTLNPDPAGDWLDGDDGDSKGSGA